MVMYRRRLRPRRFFVLVGENKVAHIATIVAMCADWIFEILPVLFVLTKYEAGNILKI